MYDLNYSGVVSFRILTILTTLSFDSDIDYSLNDAVRPFRVDCVDVYGRRFREKAEKPTSPSPSAEGDAWEGTER